MRYESLEPRRHTNRHSNRHTNRCHGDRGASLVEYALLVALIAVACIAAITSFGAATGDSLSRSGNSIVVGN